MLRRYRGTGFPEREAVVMEHALRHGFRVPRVIEIRDDGLVLERIEGPSMWDDLRRKPWRGRRYMQLLAKLHAQLHRIDAPPGLPSAGDGGVLLHLDFHPANVLLSPSGPVVIDWTNARSGPAALDVAMTWVVCATSGGLLGRAFIRPYLAKFDRRDVEEQLPVAVERRLADPNVLDEERAAVRRLVNRTSGV